MKFAPRSWSVYEQTNPNGGPINLNGNGSNSFPKTMMPYSIGKSGVEVYPEEKVFV